VIEILSDLSDRGGQTSQDYGMMQQKCCQLSLMEVARCAKILGWCGYRNTVSSRPESDRNTVSSADRGGQTSLEWQQK
jgi:hypothetical protein